MTDSITVYKAKLNLGLPGYLNSEGQCTIDDRRSSNGRRKKLAPLKPHDGGGVYRITLGYRASGEIIWDERGKFVSVKPTKLETAAIQGAMEHVGVYVKRP